MEGGDLVFLDELFFMHDACDRLRCLRAEDGGLVMDGSGGVDYLVRRGNVRLDGWSVGD
jgi:hypothetical protein